MQQYFRGLEWNESENVGLYYSVFLWFATNALYDTWTIFLVKTFGQNKVNLGLFCKCKTETSIESWKLKLTFEIYLQLNWIMIGLKFEYIG